MDAPAASRNVRVAGRNAAAGAGSSAKYAQGMPLGITFWRSLLGGLSRGTVSVRMGFVPVPRGLDDGPQVGVLRRPAQFAANLVRVATSAGGSPARRGPSFTGTLLAGHCFRRADHLADAVAAADAEVVRQLACPARASPARGGAPRPGRRRGCSRGCRCRRASGSRCRRPRCAAACPVAAWSTSGIRCVSGSWSSPMVPSGAAPAALK